MTESSRAALERAERLATLPFASASREGGTASSIRQLWAHRVLLGLLTRRELKARYKDSAGGFLWSLARPLTQLAIYYFVIGKFLNAALTIDNFAVYVFGGLTLYTLFSEIVGSSTGSIVLNSGLVKKVYLPREIFPLATVGSSLFNFAIQLVILIIAGVATGATVLGWHLLLAPAAVTVILIYAVALGVLLAATNVYLRDVQYLVEVMLMLLMWASPIVYSWQAVVRAFPGWLSELYLDNPITIGVLAFQRAFWSPRAPLPPAFGLRLLVAALVGLALVWIAQRVFARLEGNFAQEL